MCRPSLFFKPQQQPSSSLSFTTTGPRRRYRGSRLFVVRENQVRSGGAQIHQIGLPGKHVHDHWDLFHVLWLALRNRDGRFDRRTRSRTRLGYAPERSSLHTGSLCPLYGGRHCHERSSQRCLGQCNHCHGWSRIGIARSWSRGLGSACN